MEKKFTQGDWHADSNEIRDYKGLIIATVYTHLEINMPLKEKLANAKLIAAAPDLLDALIGLSSEYKSLADSGDCGAWKAEYQTEFIKAEKAIKKALE